MKRFIFVLAVGVIMAVMLVAMGAPAFAAGKHLGSPKAGQTDENPGFENDEVGDEANNVCFNHGVCNPNPDIIQGREVSENANVSEHGNGTANN